MHRKIVWLLVSCLMVATLVLASCGPAEEEEEVTLPPVGEEEEEVQPSEEEEEVTQPLEKPGYGGIFIQCWGRDALYFDEAQGLCYYAITVPLTNECLFQGDLLKGPGGTREASWVYNMDPHPDNIAGGLAESWELADPETIVFHIRKGVHFHDKPPTNGREMTADDVAFSLNRLWQTPGAYHYMAYNWELHGETIEATDKWTVTIKCKPGMTGRVYRFAIWYSHIVPHEVVDQYGNMGDWRNACGTGAFMLVDYVDASAATFVRNPDYWMKDPRYPDNQLPYADGVKQLVIVDLSTRLAAIRTGKVDSLVELTGALLWEDAQQLMKSNPELKWGKALTGTAAGLFMRVDRPELPWYEKKVRHALFMAVDQQEIADTYYSGQAVAFAWPVLPIPEFADMFVPLEQFPASIREIYEYNPDRAKQLLAEAGYPDGFKAEVVCVQAHTDLLSITKDYWSKIGVDLQIDVRETGAYTTIGFKRTHEEMYVSGVNPTVWSTFSRLEKDQGYNYSCINDPLIEEAWRKITEAYFDEPLKRQIYKELAPHLLEQAYILPLPAYYVFTPWQPWIKGYNGEILVGSLGSLTDFAKYVWIDQDLKEEMTGRR